MTHVEPEPYRGEDLQSALGTGEVALVGNDGGYRKCSSKAGFWCCS
jgi:hypothetical protein